MDSFLGKGGKRVVVRVELYCANNLDILPRLTLSKIDAVITDPPYGIEYDPKRYNASTTTQSEFEAIEGDEAEFDPRPWLKFPTVILWGANNYTRHLPLGGWLCWDKRCSKKADKMFGSPFELAWINHRKTFKIARIQHGGVVNADGYGVKRVHPTQKPVKLMRWCLEVGKIPEGATVLDPYMGSGTMGIACIREGINFIGIEVDQGYFEIAEARIKAEQRKVIQKGF